MTFKKKMCSFFEDTTPTRCEVDWALLAVRISIGLFFVTHGYSKLFAAAPGIEGFTGMLAGLGFPAAVLFAYLVGIAEFFGGIAILVGLFTRFSAFWLSIITVVAWVMVKGLGFGFGEEGNLDLLALGGTLALVAAGPGMFSLSEKMKQKPMQHDESAAM